MTPDAPLGSAALERRNRQLALLYEGIVRLVLGLAPGGALPSNAPVDALQRLRELQKSAEACDRLREEVSAGIALQDEALRQSARRRAQLRREVAARDGLAEVLAVQGRGFARLAEILGAKSPLVDDVIAAARARVADLDTVRHVLGPFALACPARGETFTSSEGCASRTPAWRFMVTGLRSPLTVLDFEDARRVLDLPSVEPSQESGEKGGAVPGQGGAENPHDAPPTTQSSPQPEPAPLACDAPSTEDHPSEGSPA